MTATGWCMMLSSIAFVLGMTGYCFYRILATVRPPEDRRPPAPVQSEPRRRASTVRFGK